MTNRPSRTPIASTAVRSHRSKEGGAGAKHTHGRKVRSIGATDPTHTFLSQYLGTPPVTETDIEWQRCHDDPAYFIDTHCKIFDTDASAWIPFKLWPAQYRVLVDVQKHQLVVILKARQLGLTWLLICYGLWLIIFHPIAKVALFSRREEEAKALLGDEKMIGVFKHLPDWIKDDPRYHTAMLNKTHWVLRNGSTVRAFPTTAGDSYQFTYALMDEFDLVENQEEVVKAVQPTIDNGGKMVLLSRTDKSKPLTYFKRTFLAAIRKLNYWHPIFLPWTVDPKRTQGWYDAKCYNAMAATQSLDDVLEQYPATYLEAIQGRSRDKRIPAHWIDQCCDITEPLTPDKLPSECPRYEGLRVYRLPEPGRNYVGGADPAEFNPMSDPSSFHLVDELTGEEVCHLTGKYDPAVLATDSWRLAYFYNRAQILPERNSQGYALINAYENMELHGVRILNGHDGRPGWVQNKHGKAVMYSDGCDTLRTGDCIIHSESTKIQLGIIEGATQRAPAQEHDDEAISFLLAQEARTLSVPYLPPSSSSVEESALSQVGEAVTAGGYSDYKF